MKLKIIKKYKNNRYGEVFSLSLLENNIPNNRKHLRNLIGSEFEIEDDKYLLKGFSAFWDKNDQAEDNVIIFSLFKLK